ncbi:MAG TPA: Zn-dependent exopeptidase M28, partial [Candidatus Eisenbacteria bacterium]|nr:Zn-dependent exopeptidase M28 [Candidatus Eisenbacteria bacterium]
MFAPSPGEPGAAGRSRGTASEAADRDSLEAIVRYLSIDPLTSQPRSRYVQREAELASVADSLASMLERLTGVTPIRRSFQFEGRIDGRDSSFTGENIICRVEAAGQSSGVLLVTAHFDAIARRSYSDEWDSEWVHAAAPGADDNATGVAAVLEAARLLSPVVLPFDLEFVLFSAEELGRLGSIYYVSLCDDDCAGSHLGVINADMIGYSGKGTGASIMSDFRSGWLADMIIAYAARTDPSLEILLIKPGPSNWDHASFWERQDGRLPAITMAEPLAATGS